MTTEKTKEQLAEEQQAAALRERQLAELLGQYDEFDAEDDQMDEEITTEYITAYVGVPQSNTQVPQWCKGRDVFSIVTKDDDSNSVYSYTKNLACFIIDSMQSTPEGSRKKVGGRICLPHLSNGQVDREKLQEDGTVCRSFTGQFPTGFYLGKDIVDFRTDLTHTVGTYTPVDERGTVQAARVYNPEEISLICAECPLASWITAPDSRKQKPLCQERHTWILYLPAQEMFNEEQESFFSEPMLAQISGHNNGIQLALKGRKAGQSGCLPVTKASPKGGAIAGLDSFTVKSGEVVVLIPYDQELTKRQQGYLAGVQNPDESEFVTAAYVKDYGLTAKINEKTALWRLILPINQQYPQGRPEDGAENILAMYLAGRVGQNNAFGTKNPATNIPLFTISEDSMSMEEYTKMLELDIHYRREIRDNMLGLQAAPDIQTRLLILATGQEPLSLPPGEEGSQPNTSDF